MLYNPLLLAFSGDQGSHPMLTKIVMELINMHKSLLRFPAIGAHVITSPSHYCRIAYDDCLDMLQSREPGILVRLAELYPLDRCEAQIVNVRWYSLASNQIFNDVNRMLMSDDLIRSLMFGKKLITTTHWRCI